MSPFKPLGWISLLSNYPERTLVTNLIGIITYGASFGLCEPHSIPVRSVSNNYFSDEATVAEATEYVAKELAAGRLAISTDSGLFVAPLVYR